MSSLSEANICSPSRPYELSHALKSVVDDEDTSKRNITPTARPPKVTSVLVQLSGYVDDGEKDALRLV